MKIITQEDMVETLKTGVKVTGSEYVILHADETVRNILDTHRVRVEYLYHEEYGDEYVTWVITPFQLYDEKDGLNAEGGYPLSIVADVLRYMRENNKSVVDADVMKRIYELQDKQVKKILSRRYEPRLKELKEELGKLTQEKARLEQRITELNNEIAKIEQMIT